MIRIAALIALATLTLNASSIPAKPLEDREIQKLAREAKTSAEHLTVARHYEARGRAFEAKATRHEKDADELVRRDVYNPMKHKWPAMVQAPIDKARSQAMQARRAAKESFELMAKHQDLAAKASSEATE